MREGRSKALRPVRLLVVTFREAAQLADRHFQFVYARQGDDSHVIRVRPVERGALHQQHFSCSSRSSTSFWSSWMLKRLASMRGNMYSAP